MKNIVVGIDFSPSSLKALKHAIALSIKTNAKLHLIWVKTPGTVNGLSKNNVKSITKKANDLLAELVESCQKECPKSQVASIILEGHVAEELTKYADNLEDAVIVMGTHGASGVEENFAGSNALKATALSNVPLFVLHQDLQTNRDLITILAPIDTSFETLQKMKMVIACAKAFAAKVLLLGLVSPDLPEVQHTINIQLRNASNMCADANIRYDALSISITGNAAKAVIDFAKAHEVNLVAVMKEEEEDFSDFWLGRTTRQLLNHTPMPLLIIPNVSYCYSSK